MTICESTWGAIFEMVAMSRIFNITNYLVFKAMVNQSKDFAYICELGNH